MKYTIRGQHIPVTDALKDYVEKKLSRLDKYFESPPTSDGSVTLSVVRGVHGAEVTIHLPGVILRAEHRSDDMYASLDAVADKLERQIRKHKTKINRKFRQSDTIRTLLREETDQPHLEEEDYEVVRTKRFMFKPMDVEEAILQMNMVGHSFYVFSNRDTDRVNVVYRRTDGKYGLIEQNQ